MAEPGDPHDPEPETGAEPASAAPDPDDHVGFASPASLAGQPRVEPEPEPEPELFEPDPEEDRDPLLDLLDRKPAEPVDATPAWARESAPRQDPAPQPDGAMSLYAVYALILFAVPTLGVSALVGLLAVTGRETPADAMARSHFIYQQRTLWAGAVIALLGAILVVVNIGVFVLFLLALWLLVRGAVGVLRLKAGRPIADPLHWLI